MNIGDVVYLKSGSEPMTVTEVCKDGSLFVMWFERQGSKTAKLSVETLTTESPWRTANEKEDNLTTKIPTIEIGDLKGKNVPEEFREEWP